ncbi:hypothetical protein BH23ACI1_BH23ACI1_08930 [soil metagenome]
MHDHHQHDLATERLAVGLGWFSMALGVAEIAAPARVARLIGVRPTDQNENILRGYGAREIAVGLAILAQPHEPRWLWARVAGDALDIGTLGAAMSDDHTDRGRAVASMLAVAGVTALDAFVAQRLRGDVYDEDYRTPASRARYHHVRVEKAITVNKPIEQVYAFWKNFENFPRFMKHVESVEVLSTGRSKWRAKAPAGLTVKWEAETVQERENEWIAWRSVEGSQVENSGSVRFQSAPGARGTEVRVQLEYHPPAGTLGRIIAYLFGEEPEQQVKDDLRRFKQLMETGEIPLSDGPSLWRAAQPAKNPDTLRKYAGVKR